MNKNISVTIESNSIKLIHLLWAWVAAGEGWDIPNLSALSADPELPRLLRDTRPFLRPPAEGVPGVAGVRPPEDGVRLVTGVPGVVRVLPGVPGVLATVDPPPDRPCIGAWCLLLLWVGVRWWCGRPFWSMPDYCSGKTAGLFGRIIEEGNLIFLSVTWNTFKGFHDGKFWTTRR